MKIPRLIFLFLIVTMSFMFVGTLYAQELNAIPHYAPGDSGTEGSGRMAPGGNTQGPETHEPGQLQQVEQLQQALNEALDAELDVDGEFGEATAKILKEYCDQHEIEYDENMVPSQELIDRVIEQIQKDIKEEDAKKNASTGGEAGDKVSTEDGEGNTEIDDDEPGNIDTDGKTGDTKDAEEAEGTEDAETTEDDEPGDETVKEEESEPATLLTETEEKNKSGEQIPEDGDPLNQEERSVNPSTLEENDALTAEAESFPGGTTIMVEPPEGSNIGIIYAKQVNGKWEAVHDFYCASPFLLIGMCVLLVIIAIGIFIVGILLINKFRR